LSANKRDLFHFLSAPQVKIWKFRVNN
jgi:hypothetical protein